MINVTYYNSVALIYDANVTDWFHLRTKYRIIGEFLGVTRTSSIALPLALSPEEALLLIKKSVITLHRWNKLHVAPINSDKVKYEEYLNQSVQEQNIILREERKTQIESYIDQIIEGKRQKEGHNLSRDEVIEAELGKLPQLQIENVINQIFTQHPDSLKGDSIEVPIEELLSCTNDVKILVYEDLWNRGYYITCGRKFGGDFLVYLGDPISFHAIYIIKCVDDFEQTRTVTEIVAFGRLGNAVKKKFVLAAVHDKKVTYLTLNWIDTEFN